jgi:hypothetical protein
LAQTNEQLPIIGLNGENKKTPISPRHNLHERADIGVFGDAF